MPSLSFEHIADCYDATRGGLRRGRAIAAGIAPWVQGTRVLEVGIGTGTVALGLRELGHHVVGVDLSPAMLGHAVERLGCSVAVADGYQLPIAPASVDTAYIAWVLQLVPDATTFLAAMAGAVRRGGRVIVVPSHQDATLDDIETVMEGLHERLRPGNFDPPEVIRHATAAALTHVTTASTPEDIYDRSPNVEADRLEQRTYSWTWEVSDDRYRQLVAPVVAALRALPEPDRPRTKRSPCAVVVLERPA
jgi:ubiquinone/menaquinone biosynthesis C-methylase UbiE